ncbi:hypothetical protein S245_070826 [Arachis hypogaea]
MSLSQHGEFLSPRNYIVFKLKANNVIWYYLSSQGIVKPGKKTKKSYKRKLARGGFVGCIEGHVHQKAFIDMQLCTCLCLCLFTFKGVVHFMQHRIRSMVHSFIFLRLL